MALLKFFLIILLFQSCCLFANQVDAKDVCEFDGSSANDGFCAHDRFKVADANLNKRYKQLLSELDKITSEDPVRLSELKPKFILAQKEWIKFREKECDAISTWYTNGSLQGALYFSCKEKLTKERIKTINAFTDYRM